MKYFRVFKRKSDEYQMQSELEWQNVEQEHSGTCCHLKEADGQKRPTSDVLKKLSATLISAIFDQIDINIKSFLDCHPNIVFRGTEPRYFMEEKINKRILRGDTSVMSHNL